jgi:hypothetical protein
MAEKSTRRFAITLAGVFFAAMLLQLSRHVMWRDEIRTWQVCSQCASLSQLWQATRYEGVPMLWYGIVFVLTRITAHPQSMQIVHALIATAVVYVFTRSSPFSRITKTLFAFGYFPFFEYGVITRNYSLVFLLVLIACALICATRINLIALTIVLFLLTQVSIWGAGFAGVLWLTALLRTRSAGFGVAAAIVLAGIGLCIFESLPGPGPSFVGMGWQTPGATEIVDTISTVYRGLMPVPAISPHFWNTNILDSLPSVELMLGLILGVGVILLLLHRPMALSLFALGAAGLLGFSAMRFSGAVRHQGQLFILLTAAFWMAEAFPDTCRWHNAARRIFFNALMGINLLAGISAAVAGCVLPFSATKQTADYIAAHFNDRVTLVGMKDWCVSPITAYLHRPIYFPEMRKFAFYNTQNTRERYLVDRDDLIDQIATIAAGGDVLVILSSGDKLVDHETVIHLNTRKALRVKPIAKFDRSVVADEAQTIYFVQLVDERTLLPSAEMAQQSAPMTKK